MLWEWPLPNLISRDYGEPRLQGDLGLIQQSAEDSRRFGRIRRHESKVDNCDRGRFSMTVDEFAKVSIEGEKKPILGARDLQDCTIRIPGVSSAMSGRYAPRSLAV
jgi:hypothetical protein